MKQWTKVPIKGYFKNKTIPMEGAMLTGEHIRFKSSSKQTKDEQEKLGNKIIEELKENLSADTVQTLLRSGMAGRLKDNPLLRKLKKMTPTHYQFQLKLSPVGSLNLFTKS